MNSPTNIAGAPTHEDDGGLPPLDFDRWTALSARLLNLGTEERIVILDERGVALEDWMSSDEHHCSALAAEVAAGELTRAEMYGRACAAEIARRRRGGPEVSPPQDLHEPAAPTAKGETTPTPAPLGGASAAPSAEDVPSYLRELMLGVSTASSGTSSLAGTMSAPDLPSFIKRAAAKPLPFREAPSPQFLTVPSVPSSSSIPSGATMELGVDIFAQVKSALPFPGRSAPAANPTSDRQQEFPRLPLETYASLCAELSVFTDRSAEILKKYGISNEHVRRAVDNDWQGRLSAHTDTREELQRLKTTYETWLRSQPR